MFSYIPIKLKTILTSTLILCISALATAGSSDGRQMPAQFTVWGARASQIVPPKAWQEETVLNKKEYLFSKEESRIGYVLFKRHYLDLVYSYTLPEKHQISTVLKTSISRGEYEPVTFCVRALDGLKDVKVKDADLVSKSGAVIGKENIDVRVVRQFPLIIKDKKQKFSRQPLILEKHDSINIEKDTTCQYWITIYIPDDTESGDYVTQLIFEPKGRKKKEITIEVEVLPIILKEPSRVYGIYYNGDTRWKGFYPKNIRKHFIDIREHGLQTITLFDTPKIIQTDKIDIDFSVSGATSPWPIDEMMRIYIESGLPGPIIYTGVNRIIRFSINSAFGFKIFTDDFDRVYKQLIIKIDNYVKNKKWPEFFFSPVDEPATTFEKMKMASYYLELIKETLPSIKTYTTLYGGWKQIDDGKLLDEWLDVRCYDWLDKKLIRDTRKSKDELWVYNGGSFGKRPVIDRFFYGFYAEKISADGIMQWVYQWPSSLGVDPDHEFEVGAQGWYYTYPSAEGPVPTIGWEGIREGIDDARYLETLKSLIIEAEGVGTPEFIEKAQAAKKTINSILKNIDIDSQTEKRYALAKQLSRGALPFDQWRREIALKIMDLQKLLKKQKKKKSLE